VSWIFVDITNSSVQPLLIQIHALILHMASPNYRKAHVAELGLIDYEDYEKMTDKRKFIDEKNETERAVGVGDVW